MNDKINESNRTRNVLATMLGLSIIIHVGFLVAGRSVMPDWRWSHYAVHSSVEMLGAVIAIWCSWKLIDFERRAAGTNFNVYIAGALAGMGLLDGFHALCHVGNNFVWLHSAATFVGGILFALVWLPRKTCEPRHWWPLAVATAITILAVASLTIPGLVPQMVQNGIFTANAKFLNVVGGVFMLAAAGRLVWSYFSTGNNDDLLFCLHCTLFGMSAIMFEQSQLWDLPWWGWHLLRLLAYGFAMYFIYKNDPEHELSRVNEELRIHRNKLEEQVRERTATLMARTQALEASETHLMQQSELLSQGRLAALNMNQDLALAHQELAQQKDELDRSNVQLSRSNEELKQFAYVASHDLQEPLRKVNSFCGMLQDEYGDQLDDDAKSYIRYAVDGATRMRSLVSDLLDYSRVETQGNALEATEVGNACAEAIENLQASIEENEAEITVQPLPNIMADRDQLVRLFQNLIGNAIKYRSEKPPQIEVAVAGLGDEWVISVQDNGIGIEPKYFERIFVMFQRLHARDEYSGTGIGLAICKRIVDRLDGRIWLESEPSAGSKFFLSVPKRTTTPTEGATGHEHSHPVYAETH